MAQVSNVVAVLMLAMIFLSACGGESGDAVDVDDQMVGTVNPADTNVPDESNNMGLMRTDLDGQWLSNCATIRIAIARCLLLLRS